MHPLSPGMPGKAELRRRARITASVWHSLSRHPLTCSADQSPHRAGRDPPVEPRDDVRRRVPLDSIIVQRRLTPRYPHASATVLLLGILGSATAAHTMPGFTRQTGQPCVACHVGPRTSPLGPYGRLLSLDNLTVPETPSWPPSKTFLASFTVTRDAMADRRPPIDADGVKRDAGLSFLGVSDLTGYTLNDPTNALTPGNGWSETTTPDWSFPWSFVSAPIGAATPATVDAPIAGETKGLTPGYDGRTIDLNAAGAQPDASAPWITSHWHVALQKELESHFLQIGTYEAQTSTSADMTDVAAGASYRFIINSNGGASDSLSAHATIIHGIRSSATDVIFSGLRVLDAFRADASYSFSDTITPSIQYFRTAGAGGAEQYGWPGSRPNSAGIIAGVAYIPWARSNTPIQSLNLRFAAQYVAYTSFDSVVHGTGASGALYLSLWGALRF